MAHINYKTQKKCNFLHQKKNILFTGAIHNVVFFEKKNIHVVPLLSCVRLFVRRRQGFRHRGGFKRVGQGRKVAFGRGICSVLACAARPRSKPRRERNHYEAVVYCELAR
jgi:hypothetical protein